MKLAYFDCFSGISGDMVLGALVDAGLDGAELTEAIGRLGVDGIELEFRKEMRGYLSGTRAEVRVKEGPRHRHLPEIEKMIRSSTLSEKVKEQACQVFERLAAAEARVHGIAMEKVHFHEVGALDAIADIVGAVAGLELLGVTSVYASPLSLGEGTVECRHGTLPVPAPAVAYLTEGFDVRLTGIQRELTTPTGAAIITTLAPAGVRPSSFVMERVGYGFGASEGKGLPNALRIVVGRLPGETAEEVVLLETNLDDVTGESVGYLIEQCLTEGALDAYATPVQMKKSRPGLLFSALCRADRMEAIQHLILRESGTLGVRIQRIVRTVLPRETVTLDTSLGPVRVKRATLPDGTVRFKPEHDDAARIAREKGMPLRQVLETLRAELRF